MQTKFNKGVSSLILLVGFIGSHSELDSLTFAFNNAFFLKNVSVLVAHVNNTGESDRTVRYRSLWLSESCMWCQPLITEVKISSSPYSESSLFATKLLYLRSRWVNKTLTITNCSFFYKQYKLSCFIFFSSSNSSEKLLCTHRRKARKGLRMRTLHSHWHSSCPSLWQQAATRSMWQSGADVSWIPGLRTRYTRHSQ